MVDHVVINPEQHQDLKVSNQYSQDLGDGVSYAMTFPFEFRNVQAEYPIFFQKNADTGAFFPVTLFGFQQGENLFLADAKWQAHYIPLSMQRQPFLIGFQRDDSAEDKRKAVVTIDMDSPKVGHEDGQPLFEDHGGASEFLQAMTGKLEMIHAANEHCEAFVEAITKLELIEPFTLDITLRDGSENQLLGFYTLNEDKLQDLDGATMQELNQKGFLQPLFMIVASHSSLRKLVELKNARS